MKAGLDATVFKAPMIAQQNIKIQPQNMMIGTNSQWTLFIQLGLPMQLGCSVKIYYPKDLKFDYEKVQAQGLFKPPTGD